MESTNKEMMKMRLLEVSQVAPPPSALTEASLPLTYFDLPLLLLPPPEFLFFYKLPNVEIAQFNSSVLPQIKHSLSLTLQDYYPLAGNLIWCMQLNLPVIRFVEGDSVSITIVESRADFNHLSDYHARDAKDLQHLIPRLSPLEDSNFTNKQAVPTCAVQITLFPSRGVCLGITFLHSALDGRSIFSMFLKSWASTSRLGNTSLSSNQHFIAPFMDRSIIKDVEGGVLRKRYWQRLVEFIQSKSMSEKDCYNWLSLSMDLNIPPTQVAATFVLARSDIERVRKLYWASKWARHNNNTNPPYPSRFECACAYVLVCLAKIPSKTSHGNEENTSIVFAADCRARLDPPIPATYFGNCIVGVEASAKRRDVVGEDGIAMAVDTVMKAVRGLGGGEVVKWCEETLDIFIAHANGLHQFNAISGSTQFQGYKALDFGWGKPEKVEFMTKAEVSIFFSDCGNGDDGGVEIGILRGNLIWCPKLDQPVVRYVHGDGIPLTVLESNADFNHLAGYHARDAKDFQHLIPRLATLGHDSTNSSNKESVEAKAIPVQALQITLFPSFGICMGMTNLQAAFDGRAVAMFFKTWTSISQLGNTSILSSDPSLVPSFDRTFVNDVDKGLRRRYWQRLVEFIRSKSMSEKNCNNWLLASMDINGLDEQVAATFVLTKDDIQRLRNSWASMAHPSKNTKSQYPSRFELACAYVWHCLAKIPNNEEISSIAFPVDCRARINPPFPATYFGNCIVGVEASEKRRDIIGENGIAIAVDGVMKAVRGIVGDEVIRKTEETLDLLIANANDVHRFDSISGSTQFRCYKTLDFGWGRPEKVEFMTKAKVNSIYFMDCRNGDDGGLEISLLRGKDEIHAFSLSFIDGLKLSRI